MILNRILIKGQNFLTKSTTKHKSYFLQATRNFKMEANDDSYEKDFYNIFNQLIRLNQNKQIRIAVEGNIGSGKSTILSFIEKNFSNAKRRLHGRQLKSYPEPVDKWRNFNGCNLLDLLYKDPERWCFTVQSHIQLTMLEQHMADIDNKSLVKVMERSLYSAKYCFSDNLYNIGLLQKSEHDILNKWFEWITSTNDCALDLIFYLRTDPEVCLQRINMRNRIEESSTITLDYLENVHNLHDSWLLTPCTASPVLDSALKKYKPSVVLIDGNQSIEDVCNDIYREAGILLQ